jgi:hypothetical protein
LTATSLALVTVTNWHNDEPTVVIIARQLRVADGAIRIKPNKELGLVVFLLCFGMEGDRAVIILEALQGGTQELCHEQLCQWLLTETADSLKNVPGKLSTDLHACPSNPTRHPSTARTCRGEHRLQTPNRPSSNPYPRREP